MSAAPVEIVSETSDVDVRGGVFDFLIAFLQLVYMPLSFPSDILLRGGGRWGRKDPNFCYSSLLKELDLSHV